MAAATSFLSKRLTPSAALAAQAAMAEGRGPACDGTQAGAACRNQLEVLRSILDSMAEGAIAVDESGQLLFFNPAAERILRMDMTEVAPSRWAEVYGLYLPDGATPYPPDRLPLAGAMRGEAVDDAMVFVRHANAPEGIWLVVNARPLKSSSGALWGGMIVFRDVTSRRQDREALQRSEEHYRSLIENISDFISVFGPDGTLRYVSPSAEKVLGYKPEELIGKCVFDLIHPEDFPKILAVQKATLENQGVTYEEELRFRHKDGSWRIFEGVGRALRSGTAGAQTIVTSRDVTERKRTEEQVRFQASLLQQVRHAVIAVDTEGRILYWNRSAEILHQWKREEVLGKKTEELPVPLQDPGWLAEIHARVRASGFWEGEALNYRKDGSTFPAILTVAEVRDEQGRAIGFISLSADISERKQAEEDLRASREQLRKLAARLESVRESERTRIARDVHDELGQNLTALKMELAQAARKVRRDQEVLAPLRSALELIDATIGSVQRIASDLRPSVLDDFGLATAIEWQARQFQLRTAIKVELDGAPAEVRAGRTVATAAFRIFQEVLTNVARHAGASVVTISLKERAGKLILKVTDDGVGITKAQATASSSLGLIGMRERALLLGGELEIRGAPGGGTTVIVRIPCQRSGRGGKTRHDRRGRGRAGRGARC